MHNFENTYDKLNAEQKRAVDTIEGPLLVLAGPGTGKTQLLSARVAHILRSTDTAAPSILCLTFTEAAALNMRERLSSMIGELAYDVHINTYHGFASDIIKTYPEFFETVSLETGQDSRMERPIDELRQLEVVKKIIESLPFSDPLRSARYYLKSVVSTISDFKQAALSPSDVHMLAKDNTLAQEAVSKSIHTLMAPHARIPKLGEALPLFQKIHKILTDHVSELTNAAAAALEQSLESARESNSTKPLTGWKNEWLWKSDTDTWSFTNPEQSLKLESLSKVYAKYQETLERAGQYDFNDMIIKSITALQTKPELKYNLQEKYQYILLDEFQDTNVAQFELVKLLSDHPVHEGRPNIMAVGDDDQGIFAFQGADIGNMVAFLQNFRDVTIINLTQNYRSHHDILHIAHNVADQIESRLHHSLKDVSKEIVAAADNLPAQATVARHEFTSQASEQGWIADTILSLIKKGTPADDIAVLAPKHSILEALVPFLNSHGVPVAYEKRENIFDTPIIQALLLQCQFVQAANNQSIAECDALLPKILSLDFWNVPTQTIWELNWEFYKQKFTDYQPWPQLALANAHTKQATEFLLYLGAHTATLPLEFMLDYLTGAKPVTLDDGTAYTSPLKSHYFSESAQHGRPLLFYEAISHLSVIRSHLRDQQAVNEKQLSVNDLLQIYETYQEAEQPLLNTHPIAQAESAVQLQTVYKAKGLEYAYVFLPSMHDDVWGSSVTSNNSKISLPNNLKHIRHDASTEDTRRRLLFVAITRAKYGLFSTSFAQKENGKKTLPAKYYREYDDEQGRVSEIMPAMSNRVQFIDRTPEQARQDVDTLWHSRHVQLDPTLKSLLRPRLDRYVMSPTHLNTFTNIEYAGPHAFLLNTLLRFPEAIGADSIYGDALHSALEWFQKQGNGGTWPAVSSVIKQFEQKMLRSILSEDEKAAYIDRGRRALRSYLAVRADSLMSYALPEVDFRKEGVTIEGAVLTGKIDRLEIDEENKSLRIIDFKSGSASTKWSSQTKYLNYKQQLYFYMLLIEHSHTYRGYRIESAALEFIEPLTDGSIAPRLVLPFKEKEYEEFKKLVVAVWNKVQNLELPDISSYPVSPVGMRSFITDLVRQDT